MRSRTRRADKTSRGGAETLALRVLAFIAAEPERLGRFLALTGLGPDTVRAAAADPAFLPAVLDFLAENEADLLAFSAEEAIDPQTVAKARALLSGPARGR